MKLSKSQAKLARRIASWQEIANMDFLRTKGLLMHKPGSQKK